ncbi:DUF6286 domain-containing Asp23/Gls24 family envelope stress response protein [Streptomyces sp. AC602_WCS936]|uniref:DUF6286 domain-containing Asp23/Gls24 family envelope stress response protein n=1 Tax=Streptomyces sp. AC602_WCS936 TaxID=2823685 RepID=UPI001C26E807|nr:DUF6286 domain-containing protein [Streptomyces sp. AC602_WCS936]
MSGAQAPDGGSDPVGAGTASGGGGGAVVAGPVVVGSGAGTGSAPVPGGAATRAVPVPAGPARPGGTAPVDRGRTVVAERAVRRIAERSATEADLAGRRAQVAHGAATVHGRGAEVLVDVRLPYPASLGEAGERVRGRMADRVAELSGLTVRTATVRVQSLAAERAAPPPPPGDRERPSGRARRPWSARRAPAALVSLAAAAGCAVLLTDLLSVHLAGRRPARWRTGAVDWLAAHGPGDGAVVAGGAVAAVLGAWLLWLALTPGLRGVLPMAPATGDTRQRAVLDRSAVAELLRDAAAAVPGVTDVRVRCGRRRVRLRARLGFGDRDTAHTAVRAATDTALSGLGLTRPLKPRVTLRTEPYWRPPGPAPARSDRPTRGSRTTDTVQP